MNSGRIQTSEIGESGFSDDRHIAEGKSDGTVVSVLAEL